MEPRIEEIKNEFAWLKTEEIDAEEKKELTEKYGVAELPTFVFVDEGGNEMDKLTGIVPKDKIVELVLKNRLSATLKVENS